MATKKNSLGKGLSELLLNISEEKTINVKEIKKYEKNNSQLLQLTIEKILPGKFQPRKHIKTEELTELSESIKNQGILQPIIVQETSKGFAIIAGERRWRAAKLAGLKKIPAIIRDVTDKEIMAIGLVENIQRENLNSIEEAMALERLYQEFGLTHQEIANTVGKSRTTITNLLRILSLHKDVKALLAEGKIELGHAKILLVLKNHLQLEVAKQIVLKKLSIRETEQLILKIQNKKTSKTAAIDPDIRRLQATLSEKIGAVVNINHNKKGDGKLTIKYNNLEELEGILVHIN